MFRKGASKNAFSEQNKFLNTSSGVSHSFFLDERGNPLSGFVFGEAGRMILSADEAREFLSQFSLFENKKPLLGSEFDRLVEPTLSNIRRIQLETNHVLGLDKKHP